MDPLMWFTSTKGSIAIHVNSNVHAGDGGTSDGKEDDDVDDLIHREGDRSAWILFDAGW